MFSLSAGVKSRQLKHTITIYFWIKKKESKIYREKINEPTVSYAIYTEVLYKAPDPPHYWRGFCLSV